MSKDVKVEGERQKHAAGWVGFVAGVCSGMAKNTVGHPFDTIKVRLQVSEGRFTGPINALTQTIAKEGIKGLYKGFTPPYVFYYITLYYSIFIYAFLFLQFILLTFQDLWDGFLWILSCLDHYTITGLV